MRAATAILGAVLVLVPTTEAAACDCRCIAGGGDVLSAKAVRRAAPKPTPRPIVRRAPTPTPRQQPASKKAVDTLAAQLGLHRVNQVWAGDVVTKSGPVTTYTSNTVQQDAGTYAKRVATVGTGVKSSYDALLANGRTSLSDGRPVSGDIYANYVSKGSTVVFDKFVFFQDDREVAQRTPTPTPRVTPRPTPAPRPTAAPRPTSTPRPTSPPRPAAQVGRPRATPTPSPAPTRRPRSTPRPTAAPTPAPTAAPAPPRVVRAGIALAAQGDPLGRIEVLRGRRVDLWPRATVDGSPGRVPSWRLAAGEVTALGPLSGTGDEPLRAMWDVLAPTGSVFTLRIAVTVEVPGELPRQVDAFIDVVVRSPALVE